MFGRTLIESVLGESEVPNRTRREYQVIQYMKHDGKHKIENKHEAQPYEMVEQIRPDIPIYNIGKKMAQRK